MIQYPAESAQPSDPISRLDSSYTPDGAAGPSSIPFEATGSVRAGAAAGGAAPVAVLRLDLTDFRSYETARLEVDARPVVLTGPNGAGKTNLLEAVSFLAPGRGLRGARIRSG